MNKKQKICHLPAGPSGVSSSIGDSIGGRSSAKGQELGRVVSPKNETRLIASSPKDTSGKRYKSQILNRGEILLTISKVCPIQVWYHCDVVPRNDLKEVMHGLVGRSFANRDFD